MRKIFILFVLISNSLFGQTFSGKVIESKSKVPIEFVNIGIVGKNIGTTSDMKGNYEIVIDSLFNNDSILFSSIGYLPYSVKVTDFKKLTNWDIQLQKKTYELGLLLKVKKSAFLEKVDISIAVCTYDSIFYRLNIYRVRGKMEFENILQKPIYISLPKEKVKELISINLKPYNIVVEGDFLITLEHIKDLGEGNLLFSVGLSKKTYYRKTSQGIWEKIPIGIGISVTAQVEK